MVVKSSFSNRTLPCPGLTLRANMQPNRRVCVAGCHQPNAALSRPDFAGEYAAQQTCLRCRLSLRNTSNIRSGHLQQLILVDKEHDISATLDSVADTRRLTPGTSDHLFYHGQWPAMHVVLHLHGIASQVTLHFWYS